MLTKENIITAKTPHFEKQGELDIMEIELSQAFDNADAKLAAVLKKPISKEEYEQNKRK